MWRPDVKDPVQVEADDDRQLCRNCNNSGGDYFNGLCRDCAEIVEEDL